MSEIKFSNNILLNHSYYDLPILTQFHSYILFTPPNPTEFNDFIQFQALPDNYSTYSAWFYFSYQMQQSFSLPCQVLSINPGLSSIDFAMYEKINNMTNTMISYNSKLFLILILLILAGPTSPSRYYRVTLCSAKFHQSFLVFLV